ncbi:hypothetical protein [Haliangium sp.]|uniref:hypothetical protein n=1 Tax=Haliangium sp. TaxID=2663208 RepID=UPI003D13E6FD
MPRTTTSTLFCLTLAALAPACVDLDLGASSESEPAVATGQQDLIIVPQPYLCDRNFVVYRRAGEAVNDSFRYQPYCATGNLQVRGSYPGYTKLVFVQHGRSPIAQTYEDYALSAAVKAGVDDETFIVAPHFLRFNDWKKYIGDWPWDFDEGTDFHWYASDWAIGETSYQNGNKLARSSFEIYDLMVQAAIQRLPDLEEVIFIGQSAGGQFMHRYAAVSTLDLPAHLDVRYLSANSQSYLYFDGSRPYDVVDPGDVGGGSQDPPNENNCPGYNDYHVGLGSFDPIHQGYIIDVGGPQIISQYKYRDVTYLVGALDTSDPEGLSCRMDVQGPNRLERALAYGDYIQNFYAPWAINHRVQVVPGVGHGGGIIDEDCAVRWMFDDDGFCP